MVRELMYKWFGLEPIPCATCEVLKDMLAVEQQLNKVLLNKLLDKAQPEPSPQEKEAPVPIAPSFIPWRVKQQMLEAEDRKAAQLLKEKEREIAVSKLEKELGVTENAS